MDVLRFAAFTILFDGLNVISYPTIHVVVCLLSGLGRYTLYIDVNSEWLVLSEK